MQPAIWPLVASNLILTLDQALRHAHERYSPYGSILDATRAVVFFGTPHQGSDAATWAAFLGSIGKVVRLRNTEVVDELKRWSNPLVELTTVFSELRDQFQITTFYEKQTTNGVFVSPLFLSSIHYHCLRH